MKQFQREEYIHRINRVIDYIEKNIDEELKLEAISRVANFSPFHFHRIFSAIMNESLNQFIQRIRLEKAAAMLITNPKKTITEIAFSCGYSSSAAFARAFKDKYNMSASEWKNGKYNQVVENSNINQQESKNGKTESMISKEESNIGKASQQDTLYINHNINNNRSEAMTDSKPLKKLNYDVSVKEVHDMHVAYVRHIGPYKGDEALFEGLYEKLFTWAGARDLLTFPETKVLSVYHDNPEITDEDKLRVSVCITVPENTKVDGEVGTMKIQGGKYAIGHFKIQGDEYESAWNSLYGEWLPESGFQPDDRLSFEMCLNDPHEDPKKMHIVDIHIPVKPL